MNSFTRYLGILGLCATMGCIEGPLERTNILDEGANGEIILRGIPDTVFSRLESFEIIPEFTKDLPTSVSGATFIINEGGDYLVSQGGNRMGASGFVTVVPNRARILAFVYDARISPKTEKVVWVRQRPVSLDLECQNTVECGFGMYINDVRTLAFGMRDATNVPVNFPNTAFRWGTVVSRTPSVVEVVSRPAPSTIVVRALALGSAWVVLSGENLRDSVLVQVVPTVP